DGRALFAMALCGVALFPCLLYLGLRYTTAINATIINACGPMLTILLAAVLFGEAIIKKQLPGVFFGFLGVAILIFRGRLDALQKLTLNQGDLIILVAVVSWALYTLTRKRISPGRSNISISAYSVFFALPLLWAVALPEIIDHPPAFNSRVILAILFIGVFPSFISLIAWNHGVDIVGPKIAMTYINTVPVYGLLLSVFFLGESVSWPQLAGVVLVITGASWTTISGKNG
ncbi:MAG: DMT family transporter, partial [Desulfobacterales bacterium]|nr:DMT family transporter [Desulfobacterales bacterium]